MVSKKKIHDSLLFTSHHFNGAKFTQHVRVYFQAGTQRGRKWFHVDRDQFVFMHLEPVINERIR